jgi:hypothetical protein
VRSPLAVLRVLPMILVANTACHMPGFLARTEIGDTAAWKARADDAEVVSTVSWLQRLPVSTPCPRGARRALTTNCVVPFRRCRACKPTLLMKKPPSGGAHDEQLVLAVLAV